MEGAVDAVKAKWVYPAWHDWKVARPWAKISARQLPPGQRSDRQQHLRRRFPRMAMIAMTCSSTGNISSMTKESRR
jgi:hypothetical protein